MKSIIETLIDANRYQIFTKAIKEAGLSTMLSSKGPYTIYAPNDDAFHKLPEGILEQLLEDKERLKEIIIYHISPGKITSQELSEMAEIDTLQGEPITISQHDNRLMVDNSAIIQNDQECLNGVIHTIDMALMP